MNAIAPRLFVRPRHVPRAIAVLAGAVAVAIVFFGSTGCAGGGVLRAQADAPPVEVSARDGMRELSFDLTAHVSAPLAAGEVQLDVTGAGADGVAGQVRVTVVRGGVADDPAPSAAVVPCAADDEVALAHDALATCQGDCTQTFTALFASEGLPKDGAVELPVSLSAQLVYESVADAPAEDSLAITVH